MSVERLDQDKDADENVDADQVRTERPVGSEQSIDLFHTVRNATPCLVVEYVAPVPAEHAATATVDEYVTGMVSGQNAMPFFFTRTWVSPRYSASLRRSRVSKANFVMRPNLLDCSKRLQFSVEATL